MKAVKDDDRPALRYEGYDSMGYLTPILHVLTIDDARQLRDELTAVIKQCVIAEAVKHNSSNAEVSDGER
jgi:hypothetical protein